jgi:hypothetical protein
VLKKVIKYQNLFTDDEVEETFYFHLSKAELVELEMSTEGGLSESLKRIVAAEDGKQIIAEFKNIILRAYGVRSDDGRFFKKTQELRDEFESSEAYSALFMELVTQTESAVEFITSVVPAGLAAEAAEIARAETQPEVSLVPPPDESGDESPEVRQMVSDEIIQGKAPHVGGNNPAN